VGGKEKRSEKRVECGEEVKERAGLESYISARRRQASTDHSESDGDGELAATEFSLVKVKVSVVTCVTAWLTALKC
jgi:hypothetical protein